MMVALTTWTLVLSGTISTKLLWTRLLPKFHRHLTMWPLIRRELTRLRVPICTSTAATTTYSTLLENAVPSIHLALPPAQSTRSRSADLHRQLADSYVFYPCQCKSGLTVFFSRWTKLVYPAQMEEVQLCWKATATSTGPEDSKFSPHLSEIFLGYVAYFV